MKNNTKIILATAIILILSSVAVTYALIQQQQTVHISGSTTYPVDSPSPIPTSSPSPSSSPDPSVQFSLWFLNGTAFPTAISNPPMTVIALNPNAPPNIYGLIGVSPNAPTSYNLTFVARNDGDVPVNITIGANNVNVPADIKTLFLFEGETLPWWSSAVIGVGENQTLTIAFYMAAFPHNPGPAFSYSFDLTFTGAQAN
jgi:hypothetical protein